MSYLDEWGLGNLPQGIDSCSSWTAKVQGGSHGGTPVMPSGFMLVTTTNTGSGGMTITGTYQGPALFATPTLFADSAGGPDWTVSGFVATDDPTLTWNATKQECVPTGAGGVLAPPIQIKAPVTTAPPATGGASASSTPPTATNTTTVAWVAGGAAAVGLLAWLLFK